MARYSTLKIKCILLYICSITSTFAKNVHLITEEIIIDGNINESAWEQALTINDFRIIQPNNQQPHEYKTEMRVLASAEGLYFANINMISQ